MTFLGKVGGSSDWTVSFFWAVGTATLIAFIMVAAIAKKSVDRRKEDYNIVQIIFTAVFLGCFSSFGITRMGCS